MTFKKLSAREEERERLKLFLLTYSEVYERTKVKFAISKMQQLDRYGQKKPTNEEVENYITKHPELDTLTNQVMEDTCRQILPDRSLGKRLLDVAVVGIILTPVLMPLCQYTVMLWNQDVLAYSDIAIVITGILIVMILCCVSICYFLRK